MALEDLSRGRAVEGELVKQSSKRRVDVLSGWTPNDQVDLDAALAAIWTYMGTYSAEVAALLDEKREQDLARLNEILQMDRAARGDARALLEMDRAFITEVRRTYQAKVRAAEKARSK